ncbi:hypothetical protein LRR81_12160 [Metabacillus sp. GX 13764]|uniref:hypothetical protein n=1 Tax=Metabacillus kandeliae TaxID=2900151 RepID=UPI001E57570E|nr:hypothetical protein [Metabacillus kandeliae]MCD7035003.1 hypothetical protein [Metabacillus kandeliae]
MTRLDEEFEKFIGKFFGKHDGITRKNDGWMQKSEKALLDLDKNGTAFENKMDFMADKVESWILQNHPAHKSKK